ncbi:phospholipase A2, partial [uncultured Deinococcus sp.]|uniref:phospholipase A2 n=1 Tax=uncultured Deinococcus sp. TaxID=158789 RepID=UPI00374899E7
MPALRLLACAAALGAAGLGACAPRLDVPAAPAASARLTYIGRVAWGEVAAYEAEYAAQDRAPFAGLDWSRNGCSAPAGLGLGYRELFRPACNVHDFAYRNLGREAHTPENRLRSDAALLR